MHARDRRTIVLASTSKYRRALLERLGLPFQTMAPVGVDEEGFGPLPPRELARVLSRAKADSVASLVPGAIVIGSDQIACIDGAILGKPGTTAAAQAQLRRLSGRTHELVTGLCVADTASGRHLEHLDVHRISLRPLTDAEIADYVRLDQPMDCAGAYKVEGLGIALMESIQGSDFTAITGLPLMELVRMLSALGVPVLGGGP